MKGKATCYYKKVSPTQATFHLELEMLALDDTVVNKYVSRETTMDAAQDKTGEAGAAVLVLMANEIIKQADKDGYELSAKDILGHCNLKEVK